MEERKAQLGLLVGAALLFIGPALTFITIEADSSLGLGSESSNGFDSGDSSSYVLAGILVAAALVVSFISKSPGLTKGMAIVGIVGAAFGLFAGIIDVTGGVDIPPELEGLVDVSSGIGTYVVTLGALIALGGSVLLLRSAKDAPADAPPPATPAA